MVTLLGFGGGDGGSAATEWVKRHSSPFLHRFFKKNLHSVLLTNWSGTRWYDAFRCATRYCGTGGGELILLLFVADSGLGDLNLQGELRGPGPGCDAPASAGSALAAAAVAAPRAAAATAAATVCGGTGAAACSCVVDSTRSSCFNLYAILRKGRHQMQAGARNHQGYSRNDYEAKEVAPLILLTVLIGNSNID